MKASLGRRVAALEQRIGSRRCPHWSTGVRAFVHVLEGFCPTCMGPYVAEGPDRCPRCGMLLRFTLSQAEFQTMLVKLEETGVFDEAGVTSEE